MANFETAQGRNRRRAFVLLAGLFVVLAVLSAGIGRYLGTSGASLIVLVAGVSTLATWISWWKADSIVLAMTKARVVSADEAPQLHNVVEEVCIAAGLPKPRVAIVEDPAPNAFATGRDPEHAVVAFTTGLLESMDRDELQGVTAHELAHVANRDTLVMTIAATTAGIIALVADIGLRLVASSGGRRSNRKSSGGGGPLLLLVLLAAVLAPIAAMLLKGALSRSREGLADATAVQFTRNPSALRRALQKLAADSTVVRAHSNATAHLWIESPLDETRTINRWYSTHPPISERIQALWQMEGNVGFPPPLPADSGGPAAVDAPDTAPLDGAPGIAAAVAASGRARVYALLALTFGLIGFFVSFLGSALAIAFGVAARRRLSQQPHASTRRLATVGMTLGIMAFLLQIGVIAGALAGS